jgi:hypothetical protein
LQVVQERYCLVVLLLDLLDASATLLGSLRTLVGGNPLLLVATKADLLPAGASPAQLGPWLRQLARAKRLKVAGVHVVSSVTGQGGWPGRLSNRLPACLPGRAAANASSGPRMFAAQRRHRTWPEGLLQNQQARRCAIWGGVWGRGSGGAPAGEATQPARRLWRRLHLQVALAAAR